MLNVLRASRRTGRVTERYPDDDAGGDAARGRPGIDPSRCSATGACAQACPAGAITLSPASKSVRRWQLDLARCVFCGLCAEACPHGAITMTHDFELGSRTRGDLLMGVTHGGPATAGTPSLSGDTDRLGGSIRRLLRRSLHIRHMAAGSDNSTDWEIAALLNPVYDVQRLGIDFVASPRHADLLLVTGSVTRRCGLPTRPCPRPGW